MSIFEVMFNHVVFWVQIIGLPLDLMTSTNAAKIASKIGDPLKVENCKVGVQLLGAFFRVRVPCLHDFRFLAEFCRIFGPSLSMRSWQWWSLMVDGGSPGPLLGGVCEKGGRGRRGCVPTWGKG